MTDKIDSRIIAAMYKNDPEIKPKPLAVPLTENTIETHRRLNVIKLDKQALSVPSVSYVQELSKELSTVKTQTRVLMNENRQLKQNLRSLSQEIKNLKLMLDNKLDKFR